MVGIFDCARPEDIWQERRVRESRNPLVQKVKHEFLSVDPKKIKTSYYSGIISGVRSYCLDLGASTIAKIEREWRGTVGPSDYYLTLFSSGREVLNVQTGEQIFEKIGERLAAYEDKKDRDNLRKVRKKLLGKE